MLDDLDRTLRTLLTEELPQVIERIEPDGFDVTFDVPNREFTSRLTRPTLNAYLFNVQENRERGRGPWTTARQNGSGVTSRPPVRLDCTYMVTAWSSEVEDEHRLLSGAARVLFRTPLLTDEQLQGALPTDYEIRTEVAQPAAIKDVVDIWSVLDNDLKPSVRVTITVPLELEVARESPLTSGAELSVDDPGRGYGPPRPVRVEGRVVRSGQALAGVRVRVDDASSISRTDGSFELRAIRPGPKRALVWVDDEFREYAAEVTPEGRLELDLAALEEEAASDGDDD